MSNSAPHFLMLCEAREPVFPADEGMWRFSCQQVNGDIRIEAEDYEPGYFGERLQLLAVVRGLESLEQTSRVSLITTSPYVGRGIRHSLEIWRQNDWCWEHFGVMRPIKHQALWKRIDRAFQFHQVMTRVWRIDVAGFSAEESGKVASVAARVRNASQPFLSAWADELAGRMASFSPAIPAPSTMVLQ